MICPGCKYDNIDGVDECEQCGLPLWEFDPAGGDLEQSIAKHSIRVLVPKSPLAVSSKTTVRDAIAHMIEEKVGCMLVVDNGQLAGIFTERDVLYRIADNLSALDAPVRDYMTVGPQTITSQDSIAYALQQMDSGGYRHMPIVDAQGKPVGIISVRDILRFLCVRFAEIRARVG